MDAGEEVDEWLWFEGDVGMDAKKCDPDIHQDIFRDADHDAAVTDAAPDQADKEDDVGGLAHR